MEGETSHKQDSLTSPPGRWYHYSHILGAGASNYYSIRHASTCRVPHKQPSGVVSLITELKSGPVGIYRLVLLLTLSLFLSGALILLAGWSPVED